MATIGLIILLLIASAVLIGLGTLIYYLIYRHIINKRIEQGVTNKKGLMSPLWMPVILIGLQFLFGNPLLIFVLVGALTFNTVTDTEHVETHVSMETGLYSVEEMQEGYLSVYSIEENEGFAKESVISGDLRFTCFAAEDLAASWHPHYLLYAEPMGDYPEDTLYLFTFSLYGEEELLERTEQAVTQKEMPVCEISAMQEDAMTENYELHVRCTILEPEASDQLDAYFMEEAPLPQEYILDTGEATFLLSELQ